MKHIKFLSGIIISICIVIIILPCKQCKAVISPMDYPVINQIIDARLGEIYGTVNIGSGNMSTGAYNYGQYLDGEKNKLWNEINALKGNVGASSQDINDVKGKVDETNGKIDSVQQSVDNIDVRGDLDKFGEEITISADGSAADKILGVTDIMINSCNRLWSIVGDTMVNYGITNISGASINAKAYAVGGEDTIISVLTAFAYSVVLLFFAINLIEVTVKYEMLSLKSVIIITARIGIAKLLIDKSGTICSKIIDITSTLASDVIEIGTFNVMNNFPSTRDFFDKNGTKLVGPIIDIFMAILTSRSKKSPTSKVGDELRSPTT